MQSVVRSGVQGGRQSESSFYVSPVGQQPSLAPGLAWRVVVSQRTSQALPARTVLVQGSPSSSQTFGQAPAELAGIPGSHFSPGSRTPLPQPAGQSVSFMAEAPAGQQPSPLWGVVIGVFVQ